jgi:hypothetical protein
VSKALRLSAEQLFDLKKGNRFASLAVWQTEVCTLNIKSEKSFQTSRSKINN